MTRGKCDCEKTGIENQNFWRVKRAAKIKLATYTYTYTLVFAYTYTFDVFIGHAMFLIENLTFDEIFFAHNFHPFTPILTNFHQLSLISADFHQLSLLPLLFSTFIKSFVFPLIFFYSFSHLSFFTLISSSSHSFLHLSTPFSTSSLNSPLSFLFLFTYTYYLYVCLTS